MLILTLLQDTLNLLNLLPKVFFDRKWKADAQQYSIPFYLLYKNK